jgi:dTDP-4-amino-4,6-dideoxygalactose transaminase
MLATPDATIAARATRLRRFGIDALSFRDTRGEINPYSDVPEIGWSSALNNLNAAVALSQLNTLNMRLERISTVAYKLANALGDLRRLRLVRPIPGATASFWGFLVLSENRDALLEHLKVHGIKTSIFHQRNDWYTGFNTPRADLPGTELVMNQLLALPCGYWLTDAQIKELVFRVTEFDYL